MAEKAEQVIYLADKDGNTRLAITCNPEDGEPVFAVFNKDGSLRQVIQLSSISRLPTDVALFTTPNYSCSGAMAKGGAQADVPNRLVEYCRGILPKKKK